MTVLQQRGRGAPDRRLQADAAATTICRLDPTVIMHRDPLEGAVTRVCEELARKPNLSSFNFQYTADPSKTAAVLRMVVERGVLPDGRRVVLTSKGQLQVRPAETFTIDGRFDGAALKRLESVLDRAAQEGRHLEIQIRRGFNVAAFERPVRMLILKYAHRLGDALVVQRDTALKEALPNFAAVREVQRIVPLNHVDNAASYMLLLKGEAAKLIEQVSRAAAEGRRHIVSIERATVGDILRGAIWRVQNDPSLKDHLRVHLPERAAMNAARKFDELTLPRAIPMPANELPHQSGPASPNGSGLLGVFARAKTAATEWLAKRITFGWTG